MEANYTIQLLRGYTFTVNAMPITDSRLEYHRTGGYVLLEDRRTHQLKNSLVI